MERKGCIEMPSNQFEAQSNIYQATRKTNVGGSGGQAWWAASVGGASVGGASVGGVGVGGASRSETGGPGMAVVPYKMGPCS